MEEFDEAKELELLIEALKRHPQQAKKLAVLLKLLAESK
jgi:hypothetical protein